MCMILWRRQWGGEEHQICGSSVARMNLGHDELEGLMSVELDGKGIGMVEIKKFAGNSFLEGWDGMGFFLRGGMNQMIEYHLPWRCTAIDYMMTVA